MKHTKLLILSLIAVMTFSACGTDDTLQFNFPDKENNGGGNNGGGNTGGSTGESTDKNNTNKNVATDKMPTVVKNAINGLEFPKLKSNGTSYAIVHMDNTTGMVNFSTEWDDDMKSQRWSCYTFNTSNTASNVDRWKPAQGERQYPWDTDLQEQWGITDFTEDPTPTKQGFDHGHICPSADRLYSTEANKQTFYLTNMQPQYKKFNAGVWDKMEERVRRWIALSPVSDTLFVCKGGTIDNEAYILKRISNKLIVPKYFYMALLYKAPSGYKAIAFWAENLDEDKSNDDLRNYVISIDDLEQRTGIDFFCNLPDDIENKVESNSYTQSWTW